MPLVPAPHPSDEARRPAGPRRLSPHRLRVPVRPGQGAAESVRPEVRRQKVQEEGDDQDQMRRLRQELLPLPPSPPGPRVQGQAYCWTGRGRGCLEKTRPGPEGQGRPYRPSATEAAAPEEDDCRRRAGTAVRRRGDGAGAAGLDVFSDGGRARVDAGGDRPDDGPGAAGEPEQREGPASDGRRRRVKRVLWQQVLYDFVTRVTLT